MKAVTITFVHYKHSDGKAKSITLWRTRSHQLCPVSALQKYLSSSLKQTGPLFLDINGDVITAERFRSVLSSSLKELGLDPALYKSHSFRIGGATYANKLSCELSKIQALGRWKSSAYAKYIR